MAFSFGLFVTSPTVDPTSGQSGHGGPEIPPSHEEEKTAFQRGEITW